MSNEKAKSIVQMREAIVVFSEAMGPVAAAMAEATDGFKALGEALLPFDTRPIRVRLTLYGQIRELHLPVHLAERLAFGSPGWFVEELSAILDTATVKVTKWRYELRLLIRWRYRLGLTHQFNCRKCGFPIEEVERPSTNRHSMWLWVCKNCWRDSREEGRRSCWHAPRVMKRQHRFWLPLRKAMFRLRGKIKEYDDEKTTKIPN